MRVYECVCIERQTREREPPALLRSHIRRPRTNGRKRAQRMERANDIEQAPNNKHWHRQSHEYAGDEWINENSSELCIDTHPDRTGIGTQYTQQNTHYTHTRMCERTRIMRKVERKSENSSFVLLQCSITETAQIHTEATATAARTTTLFSQSRGAYISTHHITTSILEARCLLLLWILSVLYSFIFRSRIELLCSDS